MNQDKLETKHVVTPSAEATRTEAVIVGGAEATNVTVSDRSNPMGEVVSPTRGKRGGAVQPKRAGKSGSGSGPRDATPPKTTAHAPRAVAPKSKAKAAADPATAAAPSKLDQLVALLRTPSGVTLSDLQAATGWQVHSVRGAMAGALRKKGYSVTSEKPEGGLRRYRIAEAS
jgi:Protein of unknown function (DUF3489)